MGILLLRLGTAWPGGKSGWRLAGLVAGACKGPRQRSGDVYGRMGGSSSVTRRGWRRPSWHSGGPAAACWRRRYLLRYAERPTSHSAQLSNSSFEFFLSIAFTVVAISPRVFVWHVLSWSHPFDSFAGSPYFQHILCSGTANTKLFPPMPLSRLLQAQGTLHAIQAAAESWQAPAGAATADGDAIASQASVSGRV